MMLSLRLKFAVTYYVRSQWIHNKFRLANVILELFPIVNQTLLPTPAKDCLEPSANHQFRITVEFLQPRRQTCSRIISELILILRIFIVKDLFAASHGLSRKNKSSPLYSKEVGNYFEGLIN